MYIKAVNVQQPRLAHCRENRGKVFFFDRLNFKRSRVFQAAEEIWIVKINP